MAERRMFAKSVVDSDAFLDMPLSTQALYFHLSMRADDEGFINNPKKIQRMIGASDDDLKLLVAKKFIIPFDSGIVVIRHWKVHNYIQSDRFKPSIYTDEKALLVEKPNKTYCLEAECIQSGDRMYTKCIQSGRKSDTQVSIDKSKNSIDKYSVDNRLGKDRLYNDTVYYNNTELNQLFTDYLRQITDTEPLTKQEIEAEKRTLEELAESPCGGMSELRATLIVRQSIANGWYGLHPYVSRREV